MLYEFFFNRLEPSSCRSRSFIAIRSCHGASSSQLISVFRVSFGVKNDLKGKHQFKVGTRASSRKSFIVLTLVTSAPFPNRSLDCASSFSGSYYRYPSVACLLFLRLKESVISGLDDWLVHVECSLIRPFTLLFGTIPVSYPNGEHDSSKLTDEC